MGTVANELDPPAPPAATPRDPRTVVAGRYEVDLDAPLGVGGMALVYRGRHLRTRRDVAPKTLRLEYRHHPETRARFRREARLMAFMAHPNVVRVFDLNDEGEAPWVVLEYVRGRTLKELLAERGAFSPAETADILDQIAAALGHLHAGGLVHLDVKPQNLLVTPEGTVKLIDFGLAQHTGAVQEVINGATFGTAAYLAPEQASGEPVEVATDVYALGCVVYELLTGRPPFQVGAPGSIKNDVIRAHLERAPDPPSKVRPDLNLPRWIDDVVLWALAKEPGSRYGGVDTFARVFRAGVSGEQVGGLGTTNPVALLDVPTPTPTPARALTPPPSPVPNRQAFVPAPQPAPVPQAAPRPEAVPRPAWFEIPPGLVALYSAGGRAARRSLGARRALWRLTAALFVGNVMLALLLLVTQERVPGVINLDRGTVLQPGVTAEVTEARLNVRDGAGMEAGLITQVEAEEHLAITGRPQVADGQSWWPVRYEGDDGAVSGYVWQGGIQPVEDENALDWVRRLLGLE